ncbi:enoyl-CoA hydratase/isomerase family protein [Falsigemmobacter faecalis]|uniref:Enoyl-CoA hydratase/isomerase family protein n=1 Tax=Falsigemmobacter faecalis TaxID=2488730 RepID=A0A3P3DPW3_9RHOB|nr:enoyl-CoA hydratase/isomerase family protein [Falsigemmobacter faecalis]
MDPLNSHRTEGILHLELNIPSKKNALTDTLRAELRAALTAAQSDPEVRDCAVGCRGNFCPGGDISAMTSDVKVARMRILHDVVRLLRAGGRPVVAAVSGTAFGAGFSLALCCDQVIVSPDPRFSASFGRAGCRPIPRSASPCRAASATPERGGFCCPQRWLAQNRPWRSGLRMIWWRGRSFSAPLRRGRVSCRPVPRRSRPMSKRP